MNCPKCNAPNSDSALYCATCGSPLESQPAAPATPEQSTASVYGSQQPQQPAPSSAKASKQDEYLCQDLLSTEKHVSSAYNTAIFEFKDAGMRSALNHIQKEEQEHGKKLYDYMSQHNIY